MTKFYKATFSNGEVLLRSSTSRSYGAAYLLRYAGDRGGYRTDGFSGNRLLADKALGSHRSHAITSGYTSEFAEVAEAVEITGQDYRTLRSLQRGG